jgi:hypothetical protein
MLREPRRTENDILRLWLRRLRVDSNRKMELKILKVAPSSYHKYRGTKKFVPGYRESNELLVRIGAYLEVPRGRMGSFEICYNFMTTEFCAGTKTFVPRHFQYRSGHSVFIMVVPHGGRTESFGICYNFMELEYLCGDEEVCPPTVSIQK